MEILCLIFQCDKIDGITGFADLAPISGTSYYVGDDSGVQHQFIDTDVINGRTYYYALVAYDYGLEATEDLLSGIPPSENNVIFIIGIQQIYDKNTMETQNFIYFPQKTGTFGLTKGFPRFPPGNYG